MVEYLLSGQEALGAMSSATHIQSHGRMCTGPLHAHLNTISYKGPEHWVFWYLWWWWGMPWNQSPRILRDSC